MLDAGLPFAAAGSRMNPERAAAPFGGRSVRDLPRASSAAAWAQIGGGEMSRRPWDASSLPHRRQATRSRRETPTIRRPPPGREDRAGCKRPPLRPLHLHKQCGAREGVAGAAVNTRHHLHPPPSVRSLPGCAATS